jgi:hypothetical protein
VLFLHARRLLERLAFIEDAQSRFGERSLVSRRRRGLDVSLHVPPTPAESEEGDDDSSSDDERGQFGGPCPYERG